MVQSYINKYFFFLFLFALAFVIVFYQLINFQFTDEIAVLALFILFFYAILKTPDWAFNKVFLLTLGVFLFYTGYSLWIGSNTKSGIFNDLVIQLKPYLAFFCVYQLGPYLDKSRKKLLRDICLLIWMVFLLPLGVAGFINEYYFDLLIRHPAYYGIAVSMIGLCYLYCSDFTTREKLTFILLLSVGLLSAKSKFYGFFVFCTFVILFFRSGNQFKLSFRNIIILTVIFTAMFVVAWDKISLYFYQALAGNSEVEEDMIARFVLYRTAPEILLDYFPFGSGFASFATHSSGLFYSPIYTEYGIEHVYGMTKSNPKYISDTFYPTLAQFGVAGIILCISFWIYILRKAFVFYKKVPEKHFKSLLIVIFIIAFLGIEGTTGSTFIAQGGLFVMMLLGLVLSDMRHDVNQISSIEKT